MGSGCFLWCLAKDEVTGSNWNTGSFICIWEKTSLFWEWQNTGTGCPGGCGVFLCGDIQNPLGHDPSALSDCLKQGGWIIVLWLYEQMIPSGPFQPQQIVINTRRTLNWRIKGTTLSDSRNSVAILFKCFNNLLKTFPLLFSTKQLNFFLILFPAEVSNGYTISFQFVGFNMLLLKKRGKLKKIIISFLNLTDIIVFKLLVTLVSLRWFAFGGLFTWSIVF